MISFRGYIRGLSAFVAFLLLLTGCAGWGKRLEPPQITLSSFSVQEITLFESVFNVEMRIFNTSDTPLRINGLNCDLELNGKQLATGVVNVKTTIASYEMAVVPMMLYSSVLDVMRVLRVLAKAEKLEYKLSGRLRLGKGALPSTIPFKLTGTLPLHELTLQENP